MRGATEVHFRCGGGSDGLVAVRTGRTEVDAFPGPSAAADEGPGATGMGFLLPAFATEISRENGARSFVLQKAESIERRFLSWCGVMGALSIAPGSCYIRGMKKLLLAALLLTVLATPAFAAKHHRAHHHHHATTHHAHA